MNRNSIVGVSKNVIGDVDSIMIMLASTSGIHGDTLYHDPSFFIKRQVAALVVGLAGAVFAASGKWLHNRDAGQAAPAQRAYGTENFWARYLFLYSLILCCQ